MRLQKKRRESEKVKKKRDQQYRDLCDQIGKTAYGKPARELHKQLKVYGDGLPLFMRYPEFPNIVALIAFAFSMIALILTILKLSMLL